MSYKIFIDGKEGTTGLKILERFENRSDIEILPIAEDKRKDESERQKLINASDFTILCLPDDASRVSASLCTNPSTRILDASTAHRTNPDWAYGFPELDQSFRSKIETSSRVAVPGCYASGFAAIGYPLVKHGVIGADYPVVIHAVSGYSGAGKKAIALYEGENRPAALDSPRQYALTQAHKHLPEMKQICGLDYEPIFNPYVCDYFSGMTVTVSLTGRLLKKKMSAKNVWEVFAEHYDPANYKGRSMVNVVPFMGEGCLDEPFIAANTMSGRCSMEVIVYGNDDRIVVTTRFDNLGKGASGAAVQCLNIMMGIDETTGLTL
ncbi:MAG: N-acetyl-gamma-glutamyl-phosphate reductase [Treponemataceae bacterium]|nr:N-acetyl-gamma-glutamyl-phosphate reductase [Treponemataceae bacterium]